MNAEFYLILTLRLISFAILLQTIETLQIKRHWRIWFTRLTESQFQVILVLQLILLIMNLVFPNVWETGGIFAICILQFIHWRGFFNGGSDAMTFVILGASLLALIFPDRPLVQSACLWYIGIQVILSYFIAGITKVRHREWWNGNALWDVIKKSNYAVAPHFREKFDMKHAVVLAPLTVGFELLAPFCLLSTKMTVIYLSLAMIFHIGNFFVLGLNRFVFAWLASYPAVHFLADHLSR